MHCDQPILCEQPWCNVLEAMLRHGTVTLDRIGGQVRITGTIQGDVTTGAGVTIWDAIQDAYKAQSEGRE